MNDFPSALGAPAVHLDMSNATDLGMSAAFEVAVVEYCVDAVKHGETMSLGLMQRAMAAVIRRQYSLLDRPEAVRAVCDAVYDSIRAKGGAPTKRVIDDAAIAAAPADARGLLEKHRTR